MYMERLQSTGCMRSEGNVAVSCTLAPQYRHTLKTAMFGEV